MPKACKALFQKLFNVDRPHWVNIVLWTTGVVVMTGLTIKDLCPLILDYVNDDQNTQVQINQRLQDDEFKKPDVHLCFALPDLAGDFDAFLRALFNAITNGEECAQCDMFANHSYDVWNRLDLIWANETMADMIARQPTITQEEFSEALLERLVYAIATNGIENSAITVGNTSWNRPLVYSLIEYLQRVTEFEKSLLIQSNSSSSTTDVLSTAISRPNSMEHLDTLYSVITHLECELVEIDNVLALGPSSACEQHFRDSSFVSQPLSFVNSPLICGHLSLGRVSDWEIEVKEAIFRGFTNETRKLFVLMENALYDDALSNVLYGTAEGKEEEVTITYSPQYTVVEKRSGKLKSCYNESSKTECVFKCRNERLQSICACQPYTYSRLLGRTNNITRRCTHEDFAICRQHLWNDKSPRDRCFERCTHACHSIVFEWQVSPNVHLIGKYFGLTIQARRQPYLEFIMAVKDSSEDFISQIGGIFNFYLGVSGLSIIFSLVSLVDITRKAIQPEANGSQPDAPVVRHWRWAKLISVNPPRTSLEFEKKFTELKQSLERKIEILESNECVLKERLVNIGKLLDSLSR